MLEQMIGQLDDEKGRYAALKRAGRRRTGDRGLQMLALSIERHLREHHFTEMGDLALRRLVLRILARAGESTPDRPRDILRFFTPSALL